MLQPRDINTHRRKIRLHYVANYWAILMFAIFVGTSQYCKAQISEHEFSAVQPTKALRSDGSDVTTVLLVDNNNRSSHGRFLNVKPAVGLLTSTARTFIQEGVTTEYATKVLGTTLDNGRLYAQLLTKSSRVLYDHENSPNPTKSYFSQQNDVAPDSDEGLDWPYNRNDYDSPVTFIKNTDYISPNQPINAFIVYPTARQQQAFEDSGAVDYRREEKKEVVMGDQIKAEALVDQRTENVLDSVQNVKESFSVSKSSSQSNNENEVKMKIKVDKVQPGYNLPTYTIKNEFAPSGFSWEDPDYDVQTEKQFLTTADKRNGKMLHQAGLVKEEMKNLPTVTYYGFADFTTIVGDTVIVFSPQTASPVNVGQITSIKGDATLHNGPAVVVSTVKTFLSHEPGMVTETIKGHTINMETTLPTMVIEPVTPYRQSKGEDEMDNEYQTTPMVTDKNEVTTMSEEMLDEITEKEIDEAAQRVLSISPNMIQPSEITSSSVTLSKPSNEDIAKVLASLASVKAAQEHQATEPLQTPFVASETKVSGGVTTIFFEDDPFDQLFQTSQSSESPIQPTTSSGLLDVSVKSMDSSTENMVEITTMEAELTTTEEPMEEATTLSQSVSDDVEITTEAIVNEQVNDTKVILDNTADIPECAEDSILSSSTQLKTLTYLTTYFIPLDDTTTTSIQAREVISTSVNYACIAPSTIVNEPIITTAVIDLPEVKKEPTTVPINKAIEKEEETTEAVMQISTEASVTEATSKATESNEKKNVADDGEGDEIELIYKTLYTTYTYLTTFFHESTSSISSRKEVVTNIVTSTLDMGQLNTDDALSNLVAQGIKPTSVGIGRPTTSFQPIENNLHGIDDIFLEGSRDVHATPALDTKNLNLSDFKTYYTTYTYFTTIFVDGETEISSRTEVYTNYVGSSITPTSMSDIVKDSASTVIYEDSDDVENNILEHTSPVKAYDNTIRRNPLGQQITNEDSTETTETSTESEDDENNIIQPSYSTMIRSGDSSSIDDNTEAPITMVTDVKSSSSDGDRQIIENVNRQWNGLLEDQISSESNTEEIVPSPTLLLQTSYTTFTYFTTMYIGKSSSNILSRLETVTNVVTETLQPSRAIQIEEASLPITYFTTFTYWTTLYKDGSVTTTSREETISNIVSPTSSIEPTSVVEPIKATTVPTIDASIVNDDDAPPAQVITTTPASSSAAVNGSEPTTYYTTYTYFTTLYVGDDTVLNSRFETVTNVVEPTVTPSGRAINLDNTNNVVRADEKIEKTKLFAPAYVPVSESVAPTQPAVVNTEPTGIISLNQGKIIDAEGISTIFYTTKAVGSNINGLYAQVIESTSSVKVDEAKKAAQTTSTPEIPGSRVHKTGLVRLIEGTIVSNRTTTLYESKVIGTIIDGRYAQIIESTSSFLIEKTVDPTGVLPSSIQPTATSKYPIKSTNIISPTSSVVQGSISEGDETEEGYEDDEEGDEDDDEIDDGTGKKKSRLTFASRKRTFTPVIRPFASRNRPTFAPKRKNLSPSSATIITRSDFTPTITATPAIKSESSRGRFTSNKRQSSSVSIPNSSVASSSSSRRFSRPSRTSAAPGTGFASSTLARSRSSASSRIQPTSTSLSGSSTRRPNIFRASSPISRPSILPSNSRFRINPTQSSAFNRGGQSSSVNTTPRPEIEESDEDNLTTNVTNFPTDTTGDDEIQTTTENTRRNQNPLLRFRRPLGQSGRAQPINTSGTTTRPITVSTRRSPLLNRGRASTTTSTTTTTQKPKPRSFQRPAFNPQPNSPNLPGRSRPGSSLFPPRGLFRPATINQDLEKDDDNSTDNQLNEDGNENTDLTNDGDIGKTNSDDNVDDTNTRDTRENKKYTIGFRKRTKRQVDYGTRTNSYSSRYRRPTSINARSLVDDSEEQEIQTTRPKVTTIGRFTPNDRNSRLQSGNSNVNSVNKNAQSNNRIRPTTSSSQSGRAQFTLREKDNLAPNTRSNFRRGNSNSYSSTNRRKTSTTVSSRPKSPRLRNYSGIVTESPYNSRNSNINSRSRASRGRTTSRSRSRSGQDNLDYAIQPSFDGTITVTHHVPTEITIPVVNGKVTEYKNILTAKKSVSIATKPFHKKVTTNNIDNGRALGFGLYMMDSNGNGDEARYNLATRIMSNGVEVIVAGDKSTLPGEPNVLRILPSSHYKQTTMPASTLKGDHMVMMLPDNLEIDELSSSLYDLNKFVTRTCLTTYTYLTTYLQDGTTTVESREKVISNTATEERNLLKISPTPTAGLTFSQTPKLAIGTFPTTYTYLNTIFDGDQPIVLTSKHTVTNTITAPDDYLSLLQPSEAVTAVHDTNTYYSTVALTKTIHDNDQIKLISTDTVFTQIVITESLPSSKMTSVMTSYVAFDVDDPLSNDLKDLATTDVVKTYYVTYTYLNTLLDNGSVIVRTNVSTSSDVVTEKLYLYSKRTEAVQATTPPVVIDTKPTKAFDSLNIFATKTYLTTFTYFTTILQVNSNDRYASSTVVDSHTNVVENVITESIPNSLFPTESLSSYYSAVQTAKNPKGIVTIATLLEGQTLEVTAIAPSETIKMSSSTGTTSVVDKLLEEDVHDNTISDDISEEAQSSNVVNSYGDQQNNKIEKIDNQVNDLIGSFNLNSLTAFGPVFNALTGLIQNNFAKNSNDKNISALKNDTIVVQEESGSNIVPASLSDISGRNPIYIPVGGIVDEEIESAESQNLQLPNFNSFVPPQPPSVKWINNNGKQIQELVIGKPSRESALLNGGIAISPGDVITANSDVIIGSRPTGISPRIPLHSNKDNELLLDPPPFQSFPHHNNNVRDSIPLQSIQTESYIGPPPPPLQQQQKNRLNQLKNQIRDSHRPVIPFNNVFNDHGAKTPPPTSHQEIRLSNSKKTLSNNYLLPPPFKPQANYHQEHRLPHKPLSQTIPLIQSNEQHIQFEQPIRQQINNHYQSQQIQIQSSQSPPNISPIKIDPLFEIQQIPEVFSTDLPPVHVLEYPIHQIEPSIPILPQASIFSPISEIIHQNHQQPTGQPLLVNLQPSQIANIIIPHGSTTALIYGGANELHKNGQYFDEPSPYIDADINLFYTNKPNKTNIQNVINVEVPHNHQQSHINIQPHRPILANHEINMNANVLSQDVNLHAPPIKFTLKEDNYPSVQLNQHFDFERIKGHVDEDTDGFDNAVSSSKHQQNEHRPAIVPVETQNPVTPSSSDVTDLFNQQSNYVVPHYNPHDFKYQPNANHHQSQKTGDFAFNNQNVFFNNEYNHSLVSNSVHNGKNYHHKNPPNVEYNGPPPQIPTRQRQRPNVVLLNEANTKSQTPQFYQHYYPQQHTNRPVGSNIFLHGNAPHQSSRPNPGKIVNFEQSSQPMQPHQKPVYINLHEHIGATHSNAPSVKDVIVDEHKDDDFENEEGEVIQESNSVPVVPGQRPKDVFNVEEPTTTPKTTFYEIQHPSSTNSNEVINTQTESNFIWNVSGTSNTNTLIDNKKPIRYPSAPPAVLINELRPENLYPSTISPVNKNRLEYGHRHRRPVIPVRPLESPPLYQPNVIEPRPSLQPPPRLNSEHQQYNLPRPSLEPPTQGPSSNPFVISKNTIGFNKNRLQISMPIDTIGSETLHTSPNVGQTEEPFDPRYTSTAKGNPFVIRLTTSPSIFEKTTPISSTFTISTTTTPKTTQATTRQSIETTRFSTTQSTKQNSVSTKQNAVSKLEITLNTGEVTTKKFIDNYAPSGGGESLGGNNNNNFEIINEENILHVQESINPHNFGIVKEESILPNRNNPHIFAVYEDKVNQQQENIKLDYPEPSPDMMPPPPTKYHEHLPPMSTEEVMGLNPPPLPTPFENEVVTQRPAGTMKSSTSANTHFLNTTTYNGFRSTSRPYRYETIYRGPQDSDTTTERTRTRTRGTTQAYQPVTRSTAKPIPLLDESESNSDLRIQKPPRIYENHKRPNIQPTPSVTTKSDNSKPSPDLQNLKGTEQEQQPSRNEGHNRQYSNLNTKYKLPSDILILGTEQSLSADTTSSSSTSSLPTRRTHTLPPREYETISTTPISTERSTNTEQIAHVSLSDQNANSNAPSSRFKTKSPPVILPTRYITNTKTLTVTTTKTTVIRSQGITTTLTLTLTKTSTILDTITHQITHTLVQPTVVPTSSLMEDDKIVATSTVQEVPVYSHYPSFPVQATANYGDKSENHPTFLEDEAHLDEFIINYDDEIKVQKSSKPNQHRNNTLHSENESIFVVMTDQKQPSVININPSMIDHPHRINAMSDDKLNEISDIGDTNSSDVVNRDEDDMTKDVNNVLLGGILIASPPRLDAPKKFSVNECRPDCKASRNELCHKIEGQMKCVCRPGFARMFPDRPCKPTYTYTINIPLDRHGTDKLKFEEALTKNTSPKYTHLSGIVHNGLDRMVMQSDLRDIYHGVQVVEFKNISTKRSSENDQLADGSGIGSVFYLQLSDNYDDMRLLDIFHKYLRNNNYSLGGTDLYSSQALIDDMTATDFDECISTKFNDCSEDAHCFNLRGTYTCSCKDGFADLSGNPIYPGRICSGELIGCEKCNYHGTCYSRGDDQMLCECFQWYAGNHCHVNLKVMLIALITVGSILFMLLLICLIMTCCKRKRPNNRTLVGMGLVANKLVPNQRTMDRRAMIQETSSETSEDTHTLPYDRNKQNQLNKNKQSNSNLSLNNKFTIATQNSSAGPGHSGTLGMEQKDRSLTVMIPRAKYHPAAPPPPPIVVATTRYNMDSAASVCSTTEAKLLSYLDASPSATTDHPRKKSTTNPLNKHGALNTTSTGALISAGFEVSATVGTENDLFEKIWLYNKLKSENEQSGFQQMHQLQEKSIKSDDIDGRNTDAKTEVASTITHGNDDKLLLSPMGEWMDIDTHNEMTMSEARSYYETTIQPSTKTFRHTTGSNKAPSRNNEEANTMAERDLGSTFLLPHTHLYKPDRGSDISGFDSL